MQGIVINLFVSSRLVLLGWIGLGWVGLGWFVIVYYVVVYPLMAVGFVLSFIIIASSESNSTYNT